MLRFLAGQCIDPVAVQRRQRGAIAELKQWSGSDDLPRIRVTAAGIGIDAQLSGNYVLGLQPGDVIGIEPAEMVHRMQNRWGNFRMVSRAVNRASTVVVAFRRPDQRVLVRNVLLPDLGDPTNTGGDVRLVAARRESPNPRHVVSSL